MRKNTKKVNKKMLRLAPTQIIAITFAVIILLGTTLLMLPISSQNGQSAGFRPALFTATSATCVTGLVLYDTGAQWSSFGQAVILCMIEIGGLGFMSVACIVIFMLRRKIGLRQRMVMAQALSINEMEGVVRLQKWVLLGSLIIQLTGAVILFLRFLPEQGIGTALKWGVFHSVSAFCNAGFDILGTGQSIATLNHDPVVMFTLMGLIVIGGLGFFVWQEVVTIRKWKNLSVYTRLVLTVTAALILGGAALILLLEWNNPNTFGGMSVSQKLMNGLFQSVTLRTAGFAAVDQVLLTDGSKGLSLLLMLIGGSSGSTAGGVKTVTFLVLCLFVISRARGRSTVTVLHRNVPHEKVLDAATIVGLVVFLALSGAVLVTATSQVSFIDAIFETFSALATVGLTAGVTPLLSIPAQFVIILFMYFGRVGILTLSLGFLMGNQAQERFRYADTNLLIG